MNKRAFLLTIVLFVSVTPAVFAQARSAYLESGGGAAVDAKGVRYEGKKFPGKLTPWMADRIKSVAPDYPFRARAMHHEGEGYFQLILDLKTGSVTKVAIQESTGFASLDRCAVAALRQWRWKPGKWKLIETPVRFVLSYSEPTLVPSHGDKPTFVLTSRELPRTRDSVEFYSGDLAQFVNGRLRPTFRSIWFVGGVQSPGNAFVSGWPTKFGIRSCRS